MTLNNVFEQITKTKWCYIVYLLLHLIVAGWRHAITSVRRRSKAFKSVRASNTSIIYVNVGVSSIRIENYKQINYYRTKAIKYIKPRLTINIDL